MINLGNAIRIDRIKIYEGWQVRTWPIDSNVPGDLVLTSDGVVGWYPLRLKGRAAWEAPISGFTNIADAPFGIYKHRAIAATVLDKRKIFFFTGITHFLARGESLATHVPGFHHLVGMAVLAKNQYLDNAGSTGRAAESTAYWRNALSDNDYSQARPRPSEG